MKITELENKLRNHAQITKSIIPVPFDLEDEIRMAKSNDTSKNKSRITIKRLFVIAAVLVFCITTVIMTPLANSLKGFFSDIVRFDGAVTGTKYENATYEIKIEVSELTNKDGNTIIPLNLTFKNPAQAPFLYIQEIVVAEYRILDSQNKEIVRIKHSAQTGEKGIISEGMALINLSLKDVSLKSGEEYTIIIEKMYGLSKADSPLHITGEWMCKFAE